MNTISELFTLYTCVLIFLMFLCNVPLPFSFIIHIVVIFYLAICGLSIISHVCDLFTYVVLRVFLCSAPI